jgi:hypothetical protein
MKILRLIKAAASLMALVGFLGIENRAAEAPDFRRDINPALLYFQAYQYLPQLSEEDNKHLFDHPGAWPDQPFDERALGLLKQYDKAFKLIHRARFAQVPCEWGYDLSDGPDALLPGLAPAKRMAQAARLRAMVSLDATQFEPMRDNVIAAYTLGRNLSADRILISTLVQIAIENILTSVIMENYYRLSADQLDELIQGFDRAPRRGLIVDTISTEHDSFYGSIARTVQKISADADGNSDAFWTRFEAFWNPIATDPESKTGPEPSAVRIRQIVGGDPAGTLRLLNELPALYKETARVMLLPYPEYKTQAPILWDQFTNSKNPFIKQFFPLFTKLRGKEFSAVVRQEMVRAAAAYKRGGADSMRAIHDPLIGEPFEFSRVEIEGVDRGFRLKCKEQFRDFPEVMIFLEKPGKHFYLDGKNAGTSW